jgi:hypothetical protein
MNGFYIPRRQWPFLPHSIIHDPGTLTPVEYLKHSDGSAKYERQPNGQIVVMRHKKANT